MTKIKPKHTLSPDVYHPEQDDVPAVLADLAAAEKQASREAPNRQPEGYVWLVNAFKKADIALVCVTADDPHKIRTGCVTLVVRGPFGLQAYRAGMDRLQVHEPFQILRDLRGHEGRKRLAASSEWSRNARDAARRFLSALDQRILRALRQSRSLTGDTYNWIAIAPETRLRAVQSYPACVDQMRGDQDMEMAIAFGAPLEEALSLEMRCPRGCVRSLAGVSPVRLQVCGAPGFYRTGECGGRRSSDEAMQLHMNRGNAKLIAHRLAEIPAHAHPVTPAEWQAFHDVQNACDMLQSMSRGTLLKRSVSRRRDLCDLQRRFGGRSGSKVARDIEDALSAMMRTFIVPAAAASGHGNRNKLRGPYQKGVKSPNDVTRALLDLLTETSGLRGLVQFSDAWHQRVNTLDRTTGVTRALGDELVLPHVVRERVYLPNTEVWAKPITTLGGLRREGRDMQHCLAGAKSEVVITGRVLAFHLSGSGVEATATLKFDRDGVMQPDDARLKKDRSTVIGDAAVRELAEKMAPYPVEGGEDAQEALRISRARNTGIDGLVSNPDIARSDVEDLFPAYRAILPKRLRADTLDDLMAGPLFPVFRKLCRKSWPARYGGADEETEAPLANAA